MGNKYDQLSAEERGTIKVMLHQGSKPSCIAEALGRAPSTIARELRRNGARSGPGPLMGRPRLEPGYDAVRAGERAQRLRSKSRRRGKLDPQGELWPQVVDCLRQKWSPEQIACRLGSVSHETIYTALYAMPRGTLRRELIGALRHGRRRASGGRRPRSERVEKRGKLVDMVSIHVRPPEANERLLPGHWEGDLLLGTRNKSAVGTLVDRHNLFLMLVKMDGRDAVSALNGFTTAFAPLDPELRKTLTYDQGKEMALHAKLAESTGLKIYFADPHSPWQRGICENTNGLLRQYLPKGADLSHLSQRELDMIAWSMNTRPRKTLNWRTPAEAFYEHCYKKRIDPPSVALGV